ncbi:heme/hemopexin transporter protein HuxB [Campylobacterota bacterium]|nr:heme/hemopexin transporter protein HuxB [Campylobacterota bacterium]
MALKKLLIAAFAVCYGSVLWAVDMPPFGISDAVKSAEPPKSDPDAKAPEPLPIIIESAEPLSLAAGEKALIRDFKVEGAENAQGVQVAQFDAIFAAYRNTELTMQQINQIAQQVANACKEQGYFAATAIVPRQNVLQNGVLIIRVVIGKYGAITLQNRSFVSDGFVRSTLANALHGDAAKDSLERAMLLVGDMPSAALPQVTVQAGKSFGEMDFDFDVGKSERVGGYAAADNYGSKLTGRYRLSAGAAVNSPFGIADRLAIDAMISTKSDLTNGKLAYDFPLYSNGLRGSIAVSKTDYELGEEYKALDAVGDAVILGAAVSYPLIRTQRENLSIALGYERKDMEDKVRELDIEMPKKIGVWRLSADYSAHGSLFGLNSYFGVSLGVNAGELEITDDTQKSLNKAGADTVGSYQKADLAFDGALAFSDELSLLGRLRLQKSLGGKNLDGSEQMQLSGVSAVKAFPDPEYSADNGVLAGLELTYKLPPIVGITHSLGAFADVGVGQIEDDSYTNEDARTLSDIGFALNARYKSAVVKAQIARIVGNEKVESEHKRNTRFLCQIGVQF